LVDCSFAFVKNLPEYFGNSFKLFMDGAGSEYPSTYVRRDGSIGYFTVWAAQNNVPLSISLEMNSAIGYQNGEYVGGVTGTEYSEDAFKLGEYTLRNQVFRYAQWVLDKG
jgi:hypothetical protein